MDHKDVFVEEMVAVEITEEMVTGVVMDKGMANVETERIEISANDFDLLENENRLIIDRIRTNLDSLVDDNWITSYNDIEINGNSVSFTYMPAYPLKHIFVKFQI